MASDYASKMWERQQDGWGIRNIKLRFSRKLLFIWGMLAAFAAEVFPVPELHEVKNDDEYFLALANHIGTLTEVAPLELLARVVLDCGDDKLADSIFSSYNQFLDVLADPASREALEKVPFERALGEPAYAGLRDASHAFREGVTHLFFDVHPQLRDLIRQFGVF